MHNGQEKNYTFMPSTENDTMYPRSENSAG